MVHLKPLPGSPRFSGSISSVLEVAERDVRALETGGVGAIMIENFGDAPFYPGSVPAETVAAMSAMVQHIKTITKLPLGVNVLRNDGYAAMAIAAATGAAFIRVNVFSGAAVTDQGIIASDAHRIVRLRKNLGAEVKIFADVHVKHATPLGDTPIEQAAEELIERGCADALICTGAMTGKSVDVGVLQKLREHLPSAPLIAGSGVTPENVGEVFQYADAAIVGTYFKKSGDVREAVDVERVKKLTKVLSALS